MKRLVILLAALMVSACAHYVTPAAGVSLAAISETDSDIREAFAREPAAAFPTRMVIARVAQPGYTSMTNRGIGAGAYSIVMERDVEDEAVFNKLSAMPGVAGLAPLSRLLVSNDLRTTRQLREAAAQLRADMLLVYTIDSHFHTDTMQLGPLQTVALGMLNSKNSFVTSTCSFYFLDVRTGFIYGAGEASATENRRSNVWGTRDAVDRARRDAESNAFAAAVNEAEKLWGAILAEHGTS